MAPQGPVLVCLATFLDHQARGETHAALRAASDACHAAPHLPQPHYAYGEAWLAAGEPARAERAFAAALQIAPDWADAWVNYGVAHYRQGSVEPAKIAMSQALQRQPGHPAALGNLGAFLRLTGETEEAEAVLRAALAADPGNTAARLNLVADLLTLEQGEAALELLAGATMPAEPSARRHWMLQVTLALLQQNRLDEAEATLRDLAALGPIPPEFAPLWHWRQVVLKIAQGDAAGARQAAEQVAASLPMMGPNGVLEHRIMGHYDLARYFSGQDEPGRAFAEWSAGHALLRRMQPFSRAAHLALVDANIAQFNARRFTAGPVAANTDPAPVFIVGMPRSGTTLCEQIIAAHAQVHGAGERMALGRGFRAIGQGDDAACPARIADLDQAALDRLAAGYLAELHALAPDKTRIVDKMPANYLFLGMAGLLLPGARIIHCVRDPRDIGLSIFTHRFHGNHAYAHDLADLGWTIAQHGRLMAHWREALPNPVLTLRLSDWVQDFDATLAGVLTHLGLPPDPACARFYESKRRVRTASHQQVRQPVNGRGLGRWTAYAAELQPLLAELVSAGDLHGDENRNA